MILKFIWILLILKVTRAVINFINQPELNKILDGVVGLTESIASVIQWTVYICILFFIGYSLKSFLPSSFKTRQEMNPSAPESVINKQTYAPNPHQIQKKSQHSQSQPFTSPFGDQINPNVKDDFF